MVLECLAVLGEIVLPSGGGANPGPRQPTYLKLRRNPS
jgi:hypothetical protein